MCSKVTYVTLLHTTNKNNINQNQTKETMKQHLTIPVALIAGVIVAMIFTNTLDVMLQKNTLNLLLPIVITLYFCKDLKKTDFITKA